MGVVFSVVVVVEEAVLGLGVWASSGTGDGDDESLGDVVVRDLFGSE